MKSLFLIPARGGSKGIPGKNIKLFNGKPLINYSIELAREFVSDKDICVSTDDEKITKCAEEIGLKVPFLRPNELATDNATTYDVIMHALNYYESKEIIYDNVVVLQPTSPLRRLIHVQECLNMFSFDFDMVVSVKETSSNPYYVLFEENESGFLEKSKEGVYYRRQDCPKVYEFNGAVFVHNVASLKEKNISRFTKIKKYLMSDFFSIDLDTPIDWIFAETLISMDSESIFK